MKKIIAAFHLIALLLLSSSAHSTEDDPNAYTPLESTTVIIRMTGGHPYGQLSPCAERCALRLLPFSPNATIYLQGRPTSARDLQDGQELVGTVFLRTQPIDAIDQIIAQ